MFDKEYSFKGVHAERVNDLRKEFDKAKSKFFATNFDIYLIAPVIGFLYQRKAPLDNNSDIKPTKIFAEKLIKDSDRLIYNFRLIMLLDKKYEPDFESRVNKAFRGNNTPEDEELYESYVRGGVDILYEKLIQGVSNPEDYVNRLYDFLEEFNDMYLSEIDQEQIDELCSKTITRDN